MNVLFMQMEKVVERTAAARSESVPPFDMGKMSKVTKAINIPV